MKKFLLITLCFAFLAIFFAPVSGMAQQNLGAKLFKDYYCVNCHALGRIGGTVGPDLSNIGRNHSVSWIKEQIFHPGGHFALGRETRINGKIYIARMPGFNTIPPEIAEELAVYLKSFHSRITNYTSRQNPKGLEFFMQANCIACHKINGIGGDAGPNLSHIGRNRSLSWIKAQIKDPQIHFAYGIPVTVNGKPYVVIMPENKGLSHYRLVKIARYLESLK